MIKVRRDRVLSSENPDRGEVKVKLAASDVREINPRRWMNACMGIGSKYCAAVDGYRMQRKWEAMVETVGWDAPSTDTDPSTRRAGSERGAERRWREKRVMSVIAT